MCHCWEACTVEVSNNGGRLQDADLRHSQTIAVFCCVVTPSLLSTFLSNKRIAINTNLCFSLAMAQLVFLVGIENEAKYSVPVSSFVHALWFWFSIVLCMSGPKGPHTA